MIPEINVFTETYEDAKRLSRHLFRPAFDTIDIPKEELWSKGSPLVVTRDTEIWKIYWR